MGETRRDPTRPPRVVNAPCTCERRGQGALALPRRWAEESRRAPKERRGMRWRACVKGGAERRGQWQQWQTRHGGGSGAGLQKPQQFFRQGESERFPLAFISSSPGSGVGACVRSRDGSKAGAPRPFNPSAGPACSASGAARPPAPLVGQDAAEMTRRFCGDDAESTGAERTTSGIGTAGGLLLLLCVEM